jgi:uncharacterized membrane protein YdjX (TVP38/TMEM64 family)
MVRKPLGLFNRSTSMPHRLLVFLGVAAAAAIAWVLFADADTAIALLRSARADLISRADERPIAYRLGFVLVYVLVATLAVPGAVLLTLLAGALFGFAQGVGLTLLGASVGALFAFFLVRWLAGDALRERLAERLRPVSRGMEKDGGFYVFMLRVTPVVPFFLLNVLLALTPLRARAFFWISVVGMVPATLVYVNAGVQLSSLQSLADVLSPGLVVSLVLLAVFPWLARGPVMGIASWVRGRVRL